MTVEICVTHEGSRWCETLEGHNYRARVRELMEMGAAIYWMIRHS